LLEDEAIVLLEAFRVNLHVQALPAEMRHREHIVSLPSGANLVRDIRAKNKSETNSVVEVSRISNCVFSFFLLPLFLFCAKHIEDNRRVAPIKI